MVSEDAQKVALGHSIPWTDELPDQGANGPNAETDEPGTVAKSSVQRTARPGRRKYRTGTVDESSAGRTDRAALESAARAVHAVKVYGQGHVVAFNFNPLHRDLNRGDHRLVWNAILNWEAILGARP